MTLMPSPSTLQEILLFTQQHLPSRFWMQAVPSMSFQREDARNAAAAVRYLDGGFVFFLSYYNLHLTSNRGKFKGIIQ